MNSLVQLTEENAGEEAAPANNARGFSFRENPNSKNFPPVFSWQFVLNYFRGDVPPRDNPCIPSSLVKVSVILLTSASAPDEKGFPVKLCRGRPPPFSQVWTNYRIADGVRPLLPSPRRIYFHTPEINSSSYAGRKMSREVHTLCLAQNSTGINSGHFPVAVSANVSKWPYRVWKKTKTYWINHVALAVNFFGSSFTACPKCRMFWFQYPAD